ncbi:FmdB family zinc ribbon protein [Streptomyces sp. NRRL WC-3549]|uniref:FmdB family zinc ribbon protein n=1 Tax=Streptomyces sp. NRRL WC-3549 TaxID=1463925 RepID=UPI0009E95682|nr:FmdB family zinc ribbon protein [Streptomyces sp. NRRL WC-3549]
MPRYEYRCRPCDDTFEVSRPMAQSSDPATCPAGHEAPAAPAGGGGGGGCCGGGCCG